MNGARLAACAVALLAATSAARATTYNFVLDGCTGGCGVSSSAPAGSVVTSLVSTGVIDVTVTLKSGTFHDSNDSQHHALAFDLVGTPTIGISNLPSPLTANGSQSAGSISSAGVGTFEYAINFPHSSHPEILTTFSFLISGAGLGLNSFAPVGTNNVYFASDIWGGPGQNGNTGNVGAELAAGGGKSSVPEPATWALLVAGIGAIGAASRARRFLIG